MTQKKIPPGSPGHFLIGDTLEFRKKGILRFFMEAAQKYGDVVQVRLPGMPSYLVSHPDLIEQVVVNSNRDFKKHKAWRHLKRLFGQGLLTSEGDFWIRQRRLMQPAFHRQRIAAYAQSMVDFSNRMFESWKGEETRDIHHDFMKLTLQIVAQTLFSTDVTRDSEDVGDAMEVVLEQFRIRFARPFAIPDRIPTPGNRRFLKAVSKLDRIIYRLIQERRSGAAESNGDLLSMLMNATDEDGSKMTDRQVRDEAITLFLAGHETTAIALSWTCYLLGLHPEQMNKAIDLIRNHVGAREPVLEDLIALKPIEHMIMEAMRLYPPAYGFGREALHPMELGGYYVPQGKTIIVSQWVVHRDPRFFPEPKEFRPERWEGDFIKQIPRYAYFPFSGGPRICIGNAFAMMEATLILTCLLQRFSFDLVPDHPIELQPSITLRPKYGIKVILHAA